MGTMSLSSRVEKLEDAMIAPGEVLVLTVYLGQAGVGWEVAGCETEAEVQARIPTCRQNDIIVVVRAFGCALAGRPHSHVDDEILHWPHIP
jgi:FAD/FMN-containing dehydrogenase